MTDFLTLFVEPGLLLLPAVEKLQILSLFIVRLFESFRQSLVYSSQVSRSLLGVTVGESDFFGLFSVIESFVPTRFSSISRS